MPEKTRDEQIEQLRRAVDAEPTAGYVLARLQLLENEVHAATKGKAGSPEPEPEKAAEPEK